MNTKELPEYASLKNANGTLFELQTKSLLYDSILEGLSAKIDKEKDEIVIMEQLQRAVEAREKDLDQSIDRAFDDYEALLTTRSNIEFYETFLRGMESDGEDEEVRLVTKHLATLENGAHDLETGYDKNVIVQELHAIQQDIARCEKDIQKQKEALKKVEGESREQCQVVIDRRNKAILSLVIIWKERQLIQVRQAENEVKYQQLMKEHEELTKQLKEAEKKDWARLGGSDSNKHINGIPVLTEMFDYERLLASVQAPVVTTSSQGSPLSSPERTYERPTEKYSRPKESVVGCYRYSEEREPTTMVSKKATAPVVVRKEIAKKVASPPKVVEKRTISKPAKQLTPKRAAALALVVATEERSHPTTPGATKNPSPKLKTRTSPRMKNRIEVVKAAEASTSKAIAPVSLPPAAQTKKNNQEAKTTSPPKKVSNKELQEKSTEVEENDVPMDVSEASHTLPISPPNRSSTSIDLDQEFEAFGSVSSPGENARSPFPDEDIEGSFFGAGGESKDDDAADDNWF